MDDELNYEINSMLMLIINYIHQDMVMVHLFVTEPERYMSCYNDNAFAVLDEDIEAEYEEEDIVDEEEDEEMLTNELTKYLFARRLALNQHFLRTSSVLKSLDKMDQDVLDKVIAEFDRLAINWDTEEAELFESTWKGLWAAWETFVNKFYKEYGYTIVFPN